MESFASGQSLGPHLRLIRQLARGGMGEVWLAHDTARGIDVALKILDPALARESGFIELMRAESRKAGRLVHPNIVRVFGFDSAAGCHFIVMAYVPGGTLGALRGSDYVSVLRAMLPLAEALEYAHRNGIIHRDIKPANVLLDEDGGPHLVDFGIASAREPAGPLDMLRTGGSLPAMSPQQLDNQRAVVTDDIYAYGALLYELVSGRPLFYPNISETRVREEVPAPLVAPPGKPEIPALLARIVAAMLHKDPARRPPGMAAVRAVLETLLPGSAAGVADVPVIKEITRQGAANRAVAASAVRPVTLPARAVLAGFGVLLILAALVIFVLPGLMQRAPAPVSAADSKSVAVVDVVADDQLAFQAEADAALATVLPAIDALQAVAVAEWGGQDWTRASGLAATGDTAYKSRRYADAAQAYRDAYAGMQALQALVAKVLADALQAGATALAAADTAGAEAAYSLALKIEAANPVARTGLERTRRLPEVLQLLEQGNAAEVAGRWEEAAAAYAQAINIDPQWPAAQAARARVAARVGASRYQDAMNAGYAAQARQDLSGAVTAFRRALQARSGDPAATAALDQVQLESRDAQLRALQAQAKKLEAEERWVEAGKQYTEMLGLDPNLISAREGTDRSAYMAQLYSRLDAELADPDRLSDDAALNVARQVLAASLAVPNAGPQLRDRQERLQRIVELAGSPVQVRFESDGFTDVVIYKVGKLGMFEAQTLDLRPGSYVAVGMRAGYRDVRRTFRVSAEGIMQAVIVRCEEPI